MPPASPPASLIKLILVNFNVLLHIRYPHHAMTTAKQSILGLDNNGRLLQNSLLAPRTFSRAYMRRSITASRTYDQSPRGLAAVDRGSASWPRPSRPPSRTTRRPRRHCWRCGRVGAAGCSSPCPARRGPCSESSLSSAAASPASPAEGNNTNKQNNEVL